jgi:hypothetical protein
MDFIEQIRWRPEIGDPSLMGWLTVVAYGLAAVTAFAAAWRSSPAPAPSRGTRTMWLLVATLLCLFCVNKQLDLQSLLTDIGRVFAWRQGWYEERREYQKGFVLGVVALSMLLSVSLFLRYRQFWLKHFLLSFGLAFLLTFIVIRAISFHHFDEVLKHSISGVKMNWFLELSGIGLVWLAAAIDCYKSKSPSTASHQSP